MTVSAQTSDIKFSVSRDGGGHADADLVAYHGINSMDIINAICAFAGGSTTSTKTWSDVTISSTSASALAVGPNGATNPTLQVDDSTASAATGIKVKGAAAAADVAVSVISSGNNENLKIDAKGSGTITLGGTSTGNVKSNSPTIVTTASSQALAVGPNGITNPALLVDTNTASAATGVKVVAAAAAAGVAVSAVSSGNNENMTVDSKGSGTLTLNGTATGNVISGTGLLSKHATAGVGYATGAGSAQTQGSSRTTTVVINAAAGAITLFSAAGSATPASFTVTNSAVAATDVVVVSQKSGTDKYEIFVTAVASGSFQITSFTTGGTTTEQPVFNFAVIKAVAA